MLGLFILLEFIVYAGLGTLTFCFEDFKPPTIEIIAVLSKVLFCDCLLRYISYLMLLFNHSVEYENLEFDEWAIIQIVTYFVLYDAISYCIHRILHKYEIIYDKYHKACHNSSLNMYSGIIAKNMSIDGFCALSIFTGLLKLFVFGYNVKCMIAVDILDYIGYICFHSGLVITYVPMLERLREHHYIHHRRRNCNYGITPIMDWLCGTLR